MKKYYIGPIIEYDENGNVIYVKIHGYESWYEYDEKRNCIHAKDSNGYEQWNEYDEKGNCIHCKDSMDMKTGMMKTVM